MQHLPLSTAVAWLIAACVVAGCGAHRMSPVDPKPIGNLTAATDDPDANLVGAAEGFALKDYRVLYIEPFTVDPTQIKDEEDARLVKDLAAYLHAQLVKRIQASDIGVHVVDGSTSPALPRSERTLRLQGDIPRLTDGSQALRYFVGFGAGAAKAQIETRFVDADSGQVQLITIDRRAAGMGIFGGDGRPFLTESMDQMAEGLARFLKRLARGGKPGAH